MLHRYFLGIDPVACRGSRAPSSACDRRSLQSEGGAKAWTRHAPREVGGAAARAKRGGAGKTALSLFSLSLSLSTLGASRVSRRAGLERERRERTPANVPSSGFPALALRCQKKNSHGDFPQKKLHLPPPPALASERTRESAGRRGSVPLDGGARRRFRRSDAPQSRTRWRAPVFGKIITHTHTSDDARSRFSLVGALWETPPSCASSLSLVGYVVLAATRGQMGFCTKHHGPGRISWRDPTPTPRSWGNHFVCDFAPAAAPSRWTRPTGHRRSNRPRSSFGGTTSSWTRL